MTEVIELRCRLARVLFELGDVLPKGYRRFRVGVEVETVPEPTLVWSVLSSACRETILQTTDYLRRHIDELRRNRNYESRWYLDEFLTFYMFASSGDFNPSGEGTFTLTVLPTVAPPSGGYPRVYMGAKAIVGTEACYTLCRELEARFPDDGGSQ